jgi:hypothetical protein
MGNVSCSSKPIESTPPVASIYQQMKTSRLEAISIAKGLVPEIISSQSQISTAIGSGDLGEPLWIVKFFGVWISKEELGWTNNFQQLYGQGPYNDIEIWINGLNGELYRRTAARSGQIT